MNIQILMALLIVSIVHAVHAGHAPVVTAKPRVVQEIAARPAKTVVEKYIPAASAHERTVEVEQEITQRDLSTVGEVAPDIQNRIDQFGTRVGVKKKVSVGELGFERQEQQPADLFGSSVERVQQESAFKPQIDRVERVVIDATPAAKPVVQAAVASVLHIAEPAPRKEPTEAEKLAIEQAGIARQKAYEAKRKAATDAIVKADADLQAKAVADEAAVVKQAQEILAQKRAQRAAEAAAKQVALENTAATKIQAVVRGDQARMQGARKQRAATQMQALFRGHQQRKVSRRVRGEQAAAQRVLHNKLNEFAKITDAAQQTKFLMKKENSDVRAHLESQNRARMPAQAPVPVPAPVAPVARKVPVPAPAPVKKLTAAEMERVKIAREKEAALEAFAQQRVARKLEPIAQQPVNVNVGFGSSAATGRIVGEVGASVPNRR